MRKNIICIQEKEKVITTFPPVLCSVASCKQFCSETQRVGTLSLLFVPSAKGGGMEIGMEFYRSEYVPPKDMPEWNYFIPAVWDTLDGDSALLLCHNGISMKYFNGVDTDMINKYDWSEFIYFCTAPFLLSDKKILQRPFFLYGGNKPNTPDVWELRYVFTMKDRKQHRMLEENILFTMLIPSIEGTLLCKCDKCKASYVVEAWEAKQFIAKNWVPPTVRCPACRLARKIRE